MHFTLKLTQIGNSGAGVLPKATLAALKLEKGDAMYLTESPEGFRLTAYDPEGDLDEAGFTAWLRQHIRAHG